MNTLFPEGFDEVLRTKFSYEPETGKLFRMKKKLDESFEPSLIESFHPQGHLLCSLRVDRKNFIIGGARIAFFLMEGRWPGKILYKDGNNKNLKWENLTEEKGFVKTEVEQEVKMMHMQVGTEGEEEFKERKKKGRPPLEKSDKPTKKEEVNNVPNFFKEHSEAIEKQDAEDYSEFHKIIDEYYRSLTLENIKVRWKFGITEKMNYDQIVAFWDESGEGLNDKREYADVFKASFQEGKSPLEMSNEMSKLDYDRMMVGVALWQVKFNGTSRAEVLSYINDNPWRNQPVRRDYDMLVPELSKKSEWFFMTQKNIWDEKVKIMRAERERVKLELAERQAAEKKEQTLLETNSVRDEMAKQGEQENG